ncbi:MAG: S1C family serine protease [Planctomycetaceae bacterium]
MRPALLFLLFLLAAAPIARGQDLTREERVRRAVVRIEAIDVEVLRAKEMLAGNAAPEDLERVRIRQPYTVVTAGVVLSQEGEVVTTALHPLAELQVTVIFHDETRAAATLVGTDPRSHLALLRVPRATACHLELSRLEPKAGTPVSIVGDGILRGLVARGAIAREQVGLSIPDLYGTTQGRPIALGSVFVVSATAGRGSSGSPCIDADGRLLGLVFGGTPLRPLVRRDAQGALVMETREVSFVIPASRIARVLAALRAEGKVRRSRFGICLAPAGEDLRAHFDLPPSAAVVDRLEAKGPAEQAGFRIHDIILDLDGKAFLDAHQLFEAMSDCTPGERATFRILRAGKPERLDAVPTEE